MAWLSDDPEVSLDCLGVCGTTNQHISTTWLSAQVISLAIYVLVDNTRFGSSYPLIAAFVLTEQEPCTPMMPDDAALQISGNSRNQLPRCRKA